MSTKEALQQILQELPEDRMDEVLDFARFISARREDESWSEFGRLQLAKAYGNDEPEYTEADLKPELNA